MSREVDVLILGGGIYGAAATYEAARRGFSTLLVERNDFGSGTSANSLKIIHGGLRYLQSLDVRRSLHSIDERRRLLLLAPSLVKPLRCRLATSGQSVFHLGLLGAGLLVNEILSAQRNRGVPRSHHLPAARYPVWYDAIAEDTERLLMAFLLSATERHGADIRNHTTISEWIHEGGRVVGAQVPGVGEVRARAVLRCTGTYRPGMPVGVSLNVILDVPHVSDTPEAVALRHPKDGRNVFVVPWRGHTMVGTYDRDYDGDPARGMAFDPAWVEEVLAWLRPVHATFAELDKRHVRFVHAGLLPRENARSRSLKRHYSVTEAPDGGIDVLGVKYTAAYGVARHAVGVAARRLGDASPAGLPDPLVDVDALVDDFVGEDASLRRPVAPGAVATVGDVRFAVGRAGAKTLSDVLLRRTALASAGHPGADVVSAVANEVGTLRGWSDRERDAEIHAFEQSFHFA